MKIIVGNQKSYLKSDEVDSFIQKLSNISNPNVVICPSSIYLERFKKTSLLLGSQNVSNFPSGASTGELSAEQLKSIGVNFSLVGHSERRQNQKESIEDTNIKIRNLLENKIIPILCVGETKEERESGEDKKVIKEEIEGALQNIPIHSVGKIMIAYEPIWSIGTGVIPTGDEINDMAIYVKDFIKDHYDQSAIVLYGGSVNQQNIEKLNQIHGIDGYLIGGASSKIEDFLSIINKCK